MQIPSQNWLLLNEERSKSPRYVIEIAFDDAFTDLYYFTSHAGTVVPGGASVTHGVVKNISSTSQRFDPLRANSTIGNIDFQLLDDGEAISDLFRTKLASNKSLRRKRVRVYMGFDSDITLTWNEYLLIQTQLINDVDYHNGVYEFSCSDVKREQKQKIFEPKVTNLTNSISDTDTEITVVDPSAFEAFKRSAADTDAPSQTVGYIKIEDEIIKFTGTTATQFTGCTRGVLGTKPAPHEVDTDKTNDKRLKVEEFIRLEGNVVEILYQILTGTRYGTAETLPDHYHLGIGASYIRTGDFVNIGRDWWDANNPTKGIIFSFNGLKKVDGKQFIEKEILQALGAFQPIYASGELGLRRSSVVLQNSGTVAELNANNVTSYGKLKHCLEEVHNQFTLQWNWDHNLERFTRTVSLVDQDSIDTYGDADIIPLQFKGLFGKTSTTNVIVSRFDSLRSRHAGPPERIQVTCLPSMNLLEVGDIVLLNLSQVRDYNGSTNPINRAFEIQQMSVDWVSGKVTFDLFGSTLRAQPFSALAPDTSLPDSFYTGSIGTNLKTYLDANYPGSYSLVSGDMTINSDVTLPGGENINGASAIYYHDTGDLTINTGVVVTTDKNFQIRVKGFFEIKGDLDASEGGHPGGIAVNNGSDIPPNNSTIGIVGNAAAGPRIGNSWVSASGGSDSRSDRMFSYPIMTQYIKSDNPIAPSYPDVVYNPTFPEITPEIDLVNNVVNFGYTDLRGTSGNQGGGISRGTYSSKSYYGYGGSGGRSGGGICVISRGISTTGSGVIKTNGQSGSVTSYGPVACGGHHSGGAHMWAGSGGEGSPGGILLLVDGRLSTVGTLNVECNYGAPVVPSGANYQFPEQYSSYTYTEQDVNGNSWVGKYCYGYHAQKPNLNNEAIKIVYLPDSADSPQEDSPRYVTTDPTLSLQLLKDSPKSAHADLSSIECTVTPPSDTNYSHSTIYYRVQGTLDWLWAGIANDEFVISPLAANGTTYEVQARAVSITNHEAPSGPVETITLNNVVDTPEEVVFMPKVTGLEIFDKGEGKGNDNTFTGKFVAIRWNRVSYDGSYILGSEPGYLGANAGQESLYFKDYMVEVWDVDTDTLVRTEYTKDNNYLYTYEKNIFDNGGTPKREFRFEVYARGNQNQKSQTPAKLRVINPAPDLPTGISLTPSFRAIALSFTPPTDPDYQFCKIYLHTSGSFTKDATSLVATLREADEYMIAKLPSGLGGGNLLPGTTYYVSISAVDAFSEEGSTSAELSTTTLRVEDADVSTVSVGKLITGTLTADVTQTSDITINTGGSIRSGMTSYLDPSNAGFYMDNASGTPRFSIGNASADTYLAFDGTDVILGQETDIQGADNYHSRNQMIHHVFGTVGRENGGGTFTTGDDITKSNISWDGYDGATENALITIGSDTLRCVTNNSPGQVTHYCRTNQYANSYLIYGLTYPVTSRSDDDDRWLKITVNFDNIHASYQTHIFAGSFVSSGYGFFLDGTTLYGKSKKSGGSSTVSLITGFSDGTYDLEVYRNGSTLYFYVDGTLEGTLSSNLPTAGVSSGTYRWVYINIDQPSATIPSNPLALSYSEFFYMTR